MPCALYLYAWNRPTLSSPGSAPNRRARSLRGRRRQLDAASLRSRGISGKSANIVFADATMGPNHLRQAARARHGRHRGRHDRGRRARHRRRAHRQPRLFPVARRVRRCRQRDAHSAGGDFRARGRGHALPRRGRGRRHRQRHRLFACRRRVERRHRARASRLGPRARRHGVDQHVRAEQHPSAVGRCGRRLGGRPRSRHTAALANYTEPKTVWLNFARPA
jgi:hypothetical protein